MKLVAQKAQVSLQTVSRVVNKKPGVSLETRERIQAVIAELGYRPSRIASAMRGSSKTLGVVGYGLEYFGPSRTLIGVEQEANKRGYGVSLQLVQDPERLDAEAILEQMLDSRVDGIIWCIPQMDDNFEIVNEHAQTISIPLIYTDVYSQAAELAVCCDNYTGGCIATQHLIDQGHTKIAIITGPQSYVSATERQRGWRDILEQNNLDRDATLVEEGDWTAESGARCFQQLIGRHPDIAGVFAGNDPMALGAMYIALEMGMTIPGDLAIVGYDDIPESGFFRPSLSSIRLDMTKLGSSAVIEILDAIEKLQVGDQVEKKFRRIHPELIVRDSSVIRG